MSTTPSEEPEYAEGGIIERGGPIELDRRMLAHGCTYIIHKETVKELYGDALDRLNGEGVE